MKRNHWAIRAALISAALFAYAAASLAIAQVSIKVLSNRADLISGGDALVEVDLPPALSINPVYIPALRRRPITMRRRQVRRYSTRMHSPPAS